MKDSITNRYTFLGILTYSSYGMGLFFPAITGLSIIPIIVLVILLFTTKECLIDKKLFIFTSLFIGFYFLSFLWFDIHDYSSYKTIMLITKVVPLILIPCFVRQHISLYLRGVWLMLLFFLAVVFCMTIANISSIDIHTRIEFGVFNPIWISRAILECFLLSMLIMNLSRTRLIVQIILSALIIYASGSKGPLLAFIVVLFLEYVDRIKSFQKRILFQIVCVFIFIGALLGVGLLPQDSFIVQRFLTSVPEGSSEGIIEHSRVVVWPNTLARLTEQNILNWLIGNGPGSFPSFYYGQESDIRMYPHNSILEVIIENGLLALIMISAFFIYTYKKSISNLKYIFLFFVLNSFFSGDLLLNEYIFLYLSLTVNAASVRNS